MLERLIKARNKKGFTLVELIVVLVIMAILAAIMVPALLGWIDKANEKSSAAQARAVYVSAQAIATENYGKSKPLTKVTAIYSGAKTAGAEKTFIEAVEELSDITLATEDSITLTDSVVTAIHFDGQDYSFN